MLDNGDWKTDKLDNEPTTPCLSPDLYGVRSVPLEIFENAALALRYVFHATLSANANTVLRYSVTLTVQ